jgi:hypothetical protein
LNSFRNIITAKLEHRVLKGLSVHWENMVWALHRNYREALRVPVFSLRDLKTQWGKYLPDRNEIVISRELAFNHSWDAVLEVLAHETAHQLAWQALGGAYETPHGNAFQKACFLLRANPRATGKFLPLDRRLGKGGGQEMDGIILRVKKLLALAESQNRHEAEAAMKKAHQLIAKYNLETIEDQTPRDFISVFVGKPSLRHAREHYRLANLLIDFYFVKGIWAPCYVVEKDKMGRVLEISGTPGNVELASYVHDVIHQFIEHQWNAYADNKSLGHHRKTDFALGVIQGFEETLKRGNGRPVRGSASENALMIWKDPQLEAYMAYRYPKLVTFSGKPLSIDGTVLNDGVKIGKELVISKAIHHHAHGETKAIE